MSDNYELDQPKTAVNWIEESIGRRYHQCTFDNFDSGGESADAKQKAVAACAEYIRSFPAHYESGRSLLLVGPKGTGKDHLMSATIKEIAKRIDHPWKVVFRDGLTLYSEFRSAIGTSTTEDQIVAKYTKPLLLAISDPLPPKGCLSEHEQRMALRIIDARYRQSKPFAMTINAVSRKDIGERMGVQACDRLFDCAIVVRCAWESYRKELFQ